MTNHPSFSFYISKDERSHYLDTACVRTKDEKNDSLPPTALEALARQPSGDPGEPST